MLCKSGDLSQFMKNIKYPFKIRTFFDCGYENSKKIGQSKSIDIVE